MEPRAPAAALLLALVAASTLPAAEEAEPKPRRLLYVAVPGVRDYLEHGGHGLLVFDIDQEHRFVRRIPTGGLGAGGKPINVKGICASAATGLVHISTLKTLQCVDLATDRLLWEKPYEGGCDRMAISPDGAVIYLPSLEADHWHVVGAREGEVVRKIVPRSGAHNTVFGADGRSVYLAGLRSPLLTVADTARHEIARTIGPFGAPVRPFTVNGSQTLVFANVNELLGFEVADAATGKLLHRVEVAGFSKGPVKRHGCPSHGIGLTPDEKELWVADAHNQHVHVFDATVLPPRLAASLKLRDEPGWVTFSLDGRLAYPSTGEVIDVRTRKTVAALTDEQGRAVQSEKMLEIDFVDGKPARAGDQFGVGRKVAAR
jgi:hypothetical protein